jgi:cytochrome P450
MSAFCPHYPPPQPNKMPIWRAFLGARRSWMDTLYERSYAMQMGEVSLLTSKLFMVNDPACVRHVMQEAYTQYPKHNLLHEALKPLLGDSIFTTNGALWQRQRQMMNVSFAQARIQVAFRHMEGAAQAMLQRLQQLDQAQAHDIQEEMTLVAADVIFRTIFGSGIDEGDAREIFAAFTEYQALAPKLMLPAVYGLKWLTPWSAKRRSNRAAARIRAALLARIEPRFTTHAQRQQQSDYAPQDILDSLLDARDEKTGQGFDLPELLDQVAMLFLAGHETSASAMAWSLHLLAHSPDIAQRMRQERAKIASDQALQAEHLRELTLTWNVFREALRLFPPVGFIARHALSDDEMRKKKITPGDSVVISPWLIHRHRQLWDEPDAFKPDRFAQDSDSAPSNLRDAYLPFGAGPRVCIGASFAMQEAVLILSTIVHHFSLHPEPGHTPQPVGRLTVRSENGVLVRLQSLPALSAS